MNKNKLLELVERSVSYGQLTEKEAEEMVEALLKKYWKQRGLDNFNEMIVLCSHICFPVSKEDRDEYVKKAFASPADQS